MRQVSRNLVGIGATREVKTTKADKAEISSYPVRGQRKQWARTILDKDLAGLRT